MTDEAHPYIPTHGTADVAEMLETLGIKAVTDLYGSIPTPLMLNRALDIAPGLVAESDLRRTLQEIMKRNRACDTLLSFLGGGCAQHVPAVCDEICQRAEFLTAYGAEAYSDRGKYQAFFEYASLMGELLDMDAVALPTYDWANAAATAARMAARLTERNILLVPWHMSPERLEILRLCCSPDVQVQLAGERCSDVKPSTSKDFETLWSPDVAAVYIETPSYLGFIETQAAEIFAGAKQNDSIAIAGVDPLSLGCIQPPARYGADIVVGDLQPLGVHMQFGGGAGGFIASSDRPEYISQYPGFLVGLAETASGEFGYGYVDWSRTFYIKREEGNDFTGTATGLWAIVAAVFLSLHGPKGMAELARGIGERTAYARARLNTIDGISTTSPATPVFKELVVRFDETGVTVDEINHQLLKQDIIGGLDLRSEFPELGESALYCFTEIHNKSDIERLVDGLRKICARRHREARTDAGKGAGGD